MFTSRFSHKHAGRALAAFMVLLTAAFVFSTVSCKQATDPDSDSGTSVASVTGSENFIGKWTSTSSDYYEITSSAVTYYDGGYGYNWAGTPAGKYEINSTSGYIYVKYTSVGTGMSSSLVNTYIAVSYTSLGSSSAQMSTAYKSDGAVSESTLSAAVTEFTIANGYYTYYGAYSK
jgi:hypothetical protein